MQELDRVGHDDRVVDEETERDDEPRDGDHVERESEEEEPDDRAADRERDDGGDDERGSQAHPQADDGHDEQDPFGQARDEAPDRAGDPRRLVVNDSERDALRQASTERLEPRADSGADDDRVGLSPKADLEADRRLRTNEEALAGSELGFGHLGDVLDVHDLSAAALVGPGGERHRADVGGPGHPRAHFEQRRELADADFPARDAGVGRLQGGDDGARA